MEFDFVIALLKDEWEERKQRIAETKEVEIDDLLVNATLTINGELGVIREELGDIKSGIVEIQALQVQMVTKNSLYVAAFAIVGLIVAGLQLLP